MMLKKSMNSTNKLKRNINKTNVNGFRLHEIYRCINIRGVLCKRLKQMTGRLQLATNSVVQHRIYMLVLFLSNLRNEVTLCTILSSADVSGLGYLDTK